MKDDFTGSSYELGSSVVRFICVKSTQLKTESERQIEPLINQLYADDELTEEERRKKVNVLKDAQKKLIEENCKKTNGEIRYLDNECVKWNNKYDAYVNNPKKEEKGDVQIFAQGESTFTRTLGCELGVTTTEYIVVQSEQDFVLADLIKRGFDYRSEHYVFAFASAGQMRTKRNVFVKESTWNRVKDSIMCGVTMERVNTKRKDKYICSDAKFIAYMALCNSNTKPIDLDVDRMIVVPDFETTFPYKMLHFDNYDMESYGECSIEDITVPHSDGWGMMLPNSFETEAFSYRAPWFKGLFVSFDFRKFIEEKNGNPIVKDIWGKEHNIIEEDIRYISCESQFKLWKAYDSWDDYKEKFRKYNCTFGICIEEKEEYRNSEINYQMLQTLNLSQDAIDKMTERDFEFLRKISDVNNAQYALDILKATSDYDDRNWYSQIFDYYPEFINNPFARTQIKETIKYRIKRLKGGRITSNGFYRFLSPDAYAFCEWLFLGIEEPNGLLPDGYCYMVDYPEDTDIDILRAPHLYREHCIRRNVTGELRAECDKWFGVSHCMFTSCHDNSSKILNFDVDGDKVLCLPDDENFPIVEQARKDMENISGLSYEIYGAEKTAITTEGIIRTILDTYSGGDIGTPSNRITKIWNSYELEEQEKLHLVAFEVQTTNNRIDYAKTHKKHDACEEATEMVEESIQRKAPHFFQFIKNKEKDQCVELEYEVGEDGCYYAIIDGERIKTNTMDTIFVKCDLFEKEFARLQQRGWRFKKFSEELDYEFGKFDWTMLTNKSYEYPCEETELTKKYRGWNRRGKDGKSPVISTHMLTAPLSTIESDTVWIPAYREKLISLVPEEVEDEHKLDWLIGNLCWETFGSVDIRQQNRRTFRPAALAVLVSCFGEELLQNVKNNVAEIEHRRQMEKIQREVEEQERQERIVETAKIAEEIKKANNGLDTMIVCINDGIVYKSIVAAAEAYGIKRSSFSMNLNSDTPKNPFGHAKCKCADGIRREFEIYKKTF